MTAPVEPFELVAHAFSTSGTHSSPVPFAPATRAPITVVVSADACRTRAKLLLCERVGVAWCCVERVARRAATGCGVRGGDRSRRSRAAKAVMLRAAAGGASAPRGVEARRVARNRPVSCVPSCSHTKFGSESLGNKYEFLRAGRLKGRYSLTILQAKCARMIQLCVR